jgi:hypothetical protein
MNEHLADDLFRYVEKPVINGSWNEATGRGRLDAPYPPGSSGFLSISLVHQGENDEDSH